MTTRASRGINCLHRSRAIVRTQMRSGSAITKPMRSRISQVVCRGSETKRAMFSRESSGLLRGESLCSARAATPPNSQLPRRPASHQGSGLCSRTLPARMDEVLSRLVQGSRCAYRKGLAPCCAHDELSSPTQSAKDGHVSRRSPNPPLRALLPFPAGDFRDLGRSKRRRACDLRA